MAYPPPAPSEDPCCAGGPDAPPQTPQSIVVVAYPPPAPDEFACCEVLIQEFYTTTVYPVESTDVFATLADAISRGPDVSQVDEAQAWADIIAGDFFSLGLVEYTMRTEETEAWADMTGGDVVSFGLVEYTGLTEETQAWADMLSGDLARVVIDYDNYPLEETQAWADIIGGSLT